MLENPEELNRGLAGAPCAAQEEYTMSIGQNQATVRGFWDGFTTPETSPLAYARVAGILYLIIIVFGIFAEAFVRSGLIVPDDAAATAGNILASEGLFRVGFLADSIMFLSDVALAVLLYLLLRPVNRTLALVAMFFRLTQTAVLALNLLNYYAAVLLLKGTGYAAAFEPDQLHSLASLFLDLHSHGYDLGLLLFGVHAALLGYLILKSHYLPRVLGALMIAGSATYLVGSYTRFLFPDYVSLVSPIYAVALVAEVSLALWLLMKGVNVQQWERRVRDSVALRTWEDGREEGVYRRGIREAGAVHGAARPGSGL